MENAIIKRIFWLLLFISIFPFAYSDDNSQGQSKITYESSQEDKDEYIHALYMLIRQNQDSAYHLLMDFKDKLNPKEKKILIKYKNVIATYFWNIGQLDTAALIFSQNLDTAIKYHIFDQEINSMSNLGAILNVMGQSDSAYYYLKESLPLAIKNQDSSLVNKIRFDMGNYFKNKGYYHLALDQLLQAKEYYENNTESILIVYIYNSLGTLYTAIGDAKKAKFYLRSAIKIDSARDDVFLLHDIFNNMGVCLWKLQKQYDSARFYINKSYEISLQYNSPDYQLVYLLNLGGLESDAGNNQASFQYLSKAEKLASKVNNPYKLSALYINLGSYYTRNNKLLRARKYYEKGINLAESISAYDNLLNAYKGINSIDSLQGNYYKVLKKHILINALNDSLHNKEIANKIAELEIIHETKQKEKENQLLKEQNLLQTRVIQNQKIINYLIGIALVVFVVFLLLLLVNRKKLQKAKMLTDKKNKEIEIKNKVLNEQKIELEELNQTKDKFFAIIAHDLKNPFNSLLGLLDILESDFNNLDDSKKLEIIKSLSNSGRNTYNMLVNLLDWARSQRGSIEAKLESLKLVEIVESAKLFLNQRIIDKNQNVVINIDNNIQVFADKNLLLTVFINLINNAVKFTSRKGLIVVEAQIEKELVKASVTDTGVGIPNERIDELFEISSKSNSRGTENESGTGLGLILAYEFIKIMNGKIYAESKVGEGSVFYLEIPLA